MDPSRSLHKTTARMLYWNGTTKTMVPKRAQKCGNTGLRCLDMPVLGRGGLLGRNVALGPSPKFVVVSIPFCFNSMNADKRLWVRHDNAISALAHGP